MSEPYEWRAVAREVGDSQEDFDGPFATREEAEGFLAAMLAADPPYDECWLERRVCTDWERVPGDEDDDESAPGERFGMGICSRRTCVEPCGPNGGCIR